MDASSERQLCLLVRKMIPEQFARYRGNGESGFMIFNHIAFCEDPFCKKLCGENEQRVADAIAREKRTLSAFKQWEQNILRRETLHVMQERAGIK